MTVKRREEANKRRRLRRAERKYGLLLFTAKVNGERRCYLQHESMAIDLDERALFRGVAGEDECYRDYRQRLLLEKMMFGNDTEAVSALIVFRRRANGNGGHL